jgi:hypothetical protein
MGLAWGWKMRLANPSSRHPLDDARKGSESVFRSYCIHAQYAASCHKIHHPHTTQDYGGPAPATACVIAFIRAVQEQASNTGRITLMHYGMSGFGTDASATRRPTFRANRILRRKS